MADQPDGPKLTLPELESAALREAYANAEVILEYGMGGSTVIAGKTPGHTVFSVESDPKWHSRMEHWFAGNPPAATVHLHHADIGPTGKWGHPADRKRLNLWSGYPISVWERDDFRYPDLVLVDGRFRLACMLTTLLRIQRATRVLVDDYVDRPPYHAIETLVGAPRMMGRMATFQFTPQVLPVQHMRWIMAAYASPF